MDVSTIIPVYNGAASVARAVGSALRQRDLDLEVIVVDDASTDGTAAAVRQVCGGDERVRLLTLPSNAGPSAARNAGIAAARGRWIALLDADDRFEDDRLPPLVDAAEGWAADLAADNLYLDRADGPAEAPRPVALALEEPQILTGAAFVRGNLPVPGRSRVGFGFLKPLLRRSFLDRHGLRYREDLRFAEDYQLYLACLQRGARFLLLPRAGYSYAVRASSLTSRHTIEDLWKLRGVDEEVLRSPATDPEFARALRDHLKTVDQRLFWRLFIEDVKRRDPVRALSRLARGRHVARHILEQCGREARARTARRLNAWLRR